MGQHVNVGHFPSREAGINDKMFSTRAHVMVLGSFNAINPETKRPYRTPRIFVLGYTGTHPSCQLITRKMVEAGMVVPGITFPEGSPP